MNQGGRMTGFVRSRIRSFGHAFRGWWYVMRTQRNAWIHVFVTAAALILSVLAQLDTLRWAIIILTTALVFAAEFLNTAIEVVVDLASPEQHPLAKIGKDVGAGAVLISAIAAVLIGILLLGPPLWTRISPLLAP